MYLLNCYLNFKSYSIHINFTLRISQGSQVTGGLEIPNNPCKKTHPTPSLFCRVTMGYLWFVGQGEITKKNPRMVTFAKVLNLHFSADTPRPLMMWIETLIFSSLQSEPPQKKQLEVGWLLYSTYFRVKKKQWNTCIFGHFKKGYPHVCPFITGYFWAHPESSINAKVPW